MKSTKKSDPLDRECLIYICNSDLDSDQDFDLTTEQN